MSGTALSNKCFTMMKALTNHKKNSSFLWPKRTVTCEVNKMCGNSLFLFLCYVKTVCLEDLKLAWVVLYIFD